MIRNYLELVRPANVITALSDVMAGMALVGYFNHSFSVSHALVIGLASMALYAGGIVFNDIFDAELDRVERPERAIPSGRISLQNAIVFGCILNLLALALAFSIGKISGLLAILIVLSCLVYDKYAKHHSVTGPIVMGLCRGLNLLLGMSILNVNLDTWLPFALVPILYIAAITMISRGEVHGGKSKTMAWAALMYALVSGAQLACAYQMDTLLSTLPFVSLHLYLIGKPLFQAYQNPIGPTIGKAVKSGVLALIIMNAAWVSVSGNILLALAVALLLPLCIKLAKLFAVT